jgi:transcriptional regulator with XRE-family HTH domain
LIFSGRYGRRAGRFGISPGSYQPVTFALATDRKVTGFFLSLRKQKNLSQTELGKIVDVHYSHIGRYERGISRPAADTLKRMADALGVSSDYLIEGTTADAAKAKFEDRELLLQFQEVEKLEEEDKQVVKKLIDAFLTKKHIQELAR